MGGLGSAGDPARSKARTGDSENRDNRNYNGVRGGRLRMSKILRSLFAGLLLAVPAGAWAAGLGKLTILSALGQPLNAEGELVAVQKDELGSLNARLGSPDAYRQANIQFNSSLAGARATVERRAGGQPYIKVVSTRPVNEPFIDLLIELSWNAGRLVREYTALIDPPGFAPAEPIAGTTLAASPAAPVAKPLPPQAAASAPATASAPAASAPAAPAAGEYGPVKRGDTLRKIADGVRPQGVTIEQTLVGLFRSNKDAFIDNNMNRLRTGKVLRVPTQQELAALPQPEATNEIRVQTTDFNAYRQRVAGAVPEVPSDAPRQTAAGKISTTIEDKAAAQAPGKEVLRLSKGESPKGKPAAGDGKAMADRVRTLEEEATAREKSLKESTERIAKLEAMIKKMQTALELKSQSMAEAQKSAAAAKPEAKPPVDKAAPKPDTKPALVTDQKDAAPKAADPVKPPEPVKAPEPPKAAAPAKEKPADPPKADVAKADAPKPEAPTADAPKAETPKADAPKAVAAPKPKVAAPPPPPKKDFVDEMLDEPLVLAGGGGALALAGGLGFWALRRRKAAAGEADEAVPSKAEPKLAGAAAGAAAAVAAAASVEPAVPVAPATDDVDPIAEADVYIAYGRDAQAEEILKEALSKSPGRDDIKVKLLEIFASRKSAGDFNRLAGEVHGSTGGAGERWEKVAQMGYGLDPENPLYAAGRGALPLASTATAAGAPTTDIDLDFDLDMSSGGGSAPTTITDFPLDSGLPSDDVVKTATFAPGETMKMVQQGAAGLGEERTVAPIMPDFDLGTDTAAGAQTDISMSPVAPATIQADALDGGKDAGNIIDFDFDETTPVPVDASALAGGSAGGSMESTMVLTPDLQAQASDLGIELDLGADSPTIAAPPTEISAATSAAADDLKFDFDLPVPEAPASGQTSDMDKTIATQAFDLGTISLDLNSDAGASISAQPGKDAQWYDVQTKFDLAKAYQEMGDKEGAQEILREVIREGDTQQKAEAEALLSTLG